MPAKIWRAPWRSRQRQQMLRRRKKGRRRKGRRARGVAVAGSDVVKSAADSGEGWTCAKARGHQGIQHSTHVLPHGPGRQGQRHDGSVQDMPRRHTTSGVPNHPRPNTRGRTTVPCPDRPSAPAHSSAPVAFVHPAAPPGLLPLLLALHQGQRTSMQPASDTGSPSAASGAVPQAGPTRTRAAGLQHPCLLPL